MNKLDVKVGDLVVIGREFGSRSDVGTVERVTPSGRFFVGKTEFNNDGSRRGSSSYYRGSARLPKPGEVEKLRDENLRDRLASRIFSFAEKLRSRPVEFPIPTATLQKIVGLTESN